MSQAARHRTLDRSFGGEVAVWLREIRGATYDCPLCGGTMIADQDAAIRGFPHPDGLPDGDGTCWWAYMECPDCEFELTYDQFAGYRRDQ